MTLWPDRNGEAIKELAELQRIAGSRLNKTDDRLVAHTSRIESLSEQIEALQETIEVLKKLNPADVPKELEQRLTALELWKVQIMGLLTEQTSAGRPRLTRTGKSLKDFYRK